MDGTTLPYLSPDSRDAYFRVVVCDAGQVWQEWQVRNLPHLIYGRVSKTARTSLSGT